MNEMNNNDSNHFDADDPRSAPADVRGIWMALDRLAESERGSVPNGLEDRVFAASVGAVSQPPAVLAVLGRRVFTARWKLAAAVLIVGGLTAAVWMSQKQSARPFKDQVAMNNQGGGPLATSTDIVLAQVNAEFDQWLADAKSVSASDDEVAQLQSKLDAIETTPFELMQSSEELTTLEPSL